MLLYKEFYKSNGVIEVQTRNLSVANRMLYQLSYNPLLVADQRIELRPIGYEPIVLPLHSSALFEV